MRAPVGAMSHGAKLMDLTVEKRGVEVTPGRTVPLDRPHDTPREILPGIPASRRQIRVQVSYERFHAEGVGFLVSRKLQDRSIFRPGEDEPVAVSSGDVLVGDQAAVVPEPERGKESEDLVRVDGG